MGFQCCDCEEEQPASVSYDDGKCVFYLCIVDWMYRKDENCWDMTKVWSLDEEKFVKRE